MQVVEKRMIKGNLNVMLEDILYLSTLGAEEAEKEVEKAFESLYSSATPKAKESIMAFVTSSIPYKQSRYIRKFFSKFTN